MASTGNSQSDGRIVLSNWFRNNISSRDVPVDEMSKIVLKFMMQFEWDRNLLIDSVNAKGIVLSDDYKTFQITSRRGRTTIVAGTKLYFQTMKSVLWEITLSGIMRGRGLAQFMMAFADSLDRVRSDAYLGLNDRPNEFSFYIYREFFSHFGGGTVSKFNKKWKGRYCRNGDRLQLRFDFDSGRCTVSFNEEMLGVLSESLPDQLYLACSTWQPIAVTTTKLHIIYKS